MRKTILTILATTLLAGSTIQIASASEHHRTRHVVRAPVVVSEPFRDANDYYGVPSAYPDWSRYSGGFSAPAGR
jgi:hypothetical protein